MPSHAHVQVKKSSWNPFPMRIWLAWMGATMSAAVVIVIFLYQNFQTKDAFSEYKQEQYRFETDLVKRLERIEDKIDRSLGER